MGGSIIMGGLNKTHKVVTLSFDYYEASTEINTVNNFIDSLISAATKYNQNKPYTGSASYNLSSISIKEIDDAKKFPPEKNID